MLFGVDALLDIGQFAGAITKNATLLVHNLLMGRHRRHSSSKSHSRQRHSRSRSRSRSAHEQHSDNSQPQSFLPRYKAQETKTISIEEVDLGQAVIEAAFADISMAADTSMPEEIQVRERVAYVLYPSLEASGKVMEYTKGEVGLGGRMFKAQYFPFKQVNLNLIYDWFCEKCEYKNFGRRNRCYRCQQEKTPSCRLSYNHPVHPTASKYSREETSQNCSIMLRGSIIVDLPEDTLLQLFEQFCPVKDIRMIKNKVTWKNKDFAFIEFYTPEDTAVAFRQANQPDFRVNGEKVSVLYSRSKVEDQFTRLLPYERDERRKEYRKDRKEEQADNYYSRQRKMEIEEMKARPIVTLEQLKEKRENELRKNKPIAKQMTEEQSKRKQAQVLAKQWEKEHKLQSAVMYVCVSCVRKFKTLEEMKEHEALSFRHQYRLGT